MLDLEMMLAMQDDDFAEILKNDAILEALEKEKFNFQDEYTELMHTFSGKVAIGNLQLNVLTLGIWSFLYAIKNNIVCGGEVEKMDVDIFIYLLHTGYDGVSENLFEDSEDFCIKNNVDYEDAEFALYKLINIAFRPLELIPTGTTTGEKPHFNLEWLTGVVSTVCRMVNCSREFALYKMSITEAFYYYIHKLKECDYKNQIYRRNSAEIDAEIYRRTLELGKIYYDEKYRNK